MKQKSKNRFLAALLAAAMMFQLLPLMVFADEGANNESAPSVVTLESNGEKYASLEEAVRNAQNTDTIQLGEGNYTLYGISSTGTTAGKNLTFVGQGTDKTVWYIGAEVPDPNKTGEYNGDYSFDGAGTVTFQNMTLRSGTVDMGPNVKLGFIRPNNTIVEGCEIVGWTAYWGYYSAEFKNTKFKPIAGKDAIWVYSSKEATFDNCTFTEGRGVKVYTEEDKSVTVNFNNCTVENSGSHPAIYIDELKLDQEESANRYTINITGSNSVNADTNKKTCSKLFGFREAAKHPGNYTNVKIDGELVWNEGKRPTHDYADGKITVTTGEWKEEDGHYTRHVTETCDICGYKKEYDEKGYKITFDLSGCPNADDEIYNGEEPQPEEITLPEPSWAGYKFIGWKDANGAVYAAGEKMTVGPGTTLTALWEEDTTGDDTTTGGGSGDAGAAVAGVLIGGAAVIGGYEVATHVILNRVLPDGAQIPSNREELALLLWEHADKPEPQTAYTFSDIDADNTDLQKAAQWCIENGYLRTKENDDRFFPRVWVTKAKVIRTWDKAFGLQAKVEQ